MSILGIMTAQHASIAATFLFCALTWGNSVESRRKGRLAERLAGLEQQRWDRLRPAGDRPPAAVGPQQRETARELLELAIDGDRADLDHGCATAAGDEFLEGIEACRLVAGYLTIDQSPSWAVSDESLRALAGQLQDDLLPADITRREITDCLRDALRGPNPRNDQGRLPGRVFPAGREAAVGLLVTSRLLVRSAPDGGGWHRQLDQVCDVLNENGDAPLGLLPALIQRVPR